MRTLFLLFCHLSLLGQPSDGNALKTHRRIALVIGNSNYVYIPRLPTTLTDATEVTRALKAIPFDSVTLKTDLSYRDFIQVFVDFCNSLHPDDLVFFYYSGHGGQSEQENYVLPIDFEPPALEGLVKTRAVPMSALRSAVEKSGATVRIFVFDACRLVGLTTSKGLTPGFLPIAGKPTGTLIAYASAPGEAALFAPQGKLSYYTADLLGALRNPHTHIKALFEEVAHTVWVHTNGAQTPYLEGFLSESVYLSRHPLNKMYDAWLGDAKQDFMVIGAIMPRYAQCRARANCEPKLLESVCQRIEGHMAASSDLARAIEKSIRERQQMSPEDGNAQQRGLRDGWAALIRSLELDHSSTLILPTIAKTLRERLEHKGRYSLQDPYDVLLEDSKDLVRYVSASLSAIRDAFRTPGDLRPVETQITDLSKQVLRDVTTAPATPREDIAEVPIPHAERLGTSTRAVASCSITEKQPPELAKSCAETKALAEIAKMTGSRSVTSAPGSTNVLTTGVLTDFRSSYTQKGNLVTVTVEVSSDTKNQQEPHQEQRE